MTVKLNSEAVKFAKDLIKSGKYIVGTDWSEEQPSTDEENQFAQNQGWDTYAQWHLGVDTDYEKDEKSRYAFPFGDFKKVHRKGVIAAKQRAAQNDYTEIENAADDLLQMIDARESK